MRKRLIFDGSMKITEAQSTRYFAPPVLNRLMTWGFALIQETVSSRMSKHVKRCHLPKWSAMSLLIVIFCPAPNLEVFRQSFWDGRTYATFPACHIAIPPSTSLDIVELGVA